MHSSNTDVVISLLSNGADPTEQNAYSEAVPARIQAILEDGRCDVPSYDFKLLFQSFINSVPWIRAICRKGFHSEAALDQHLREDWRSP